MDEGFSKVKLKRRFGVWHSTLMLVSFVIGTGIYVTPAMVLQLIPCPGLVLVLWLLGGVICLITSLINAELAASYPVSGERYAYLRIFFGDFFAFLHLWQFTLVTRPGFNTVRCIVAAEYILQPVFPDCAPPRAAVVLIAVVIAALMSYMNTVNLNFSRNVQMCLSAIAIAVLIIIIITGFVDLGSGHTENIRQPFQGAEEMDLGNVMLGFYTLTFTYGGTSALNYIVEEIRDPSKTIPIATILGTLIVITLYVLTNISYIIVLGVDDIRDGNAIAMIFAQQTLGAGRWVILALISLTICGSLNMCMIAGSRLYFVAAREGHLPALLGLINVQHFSPITGLGVQFVFMLVMCLTLDVSTILSNFIFVNMLMNTLTIYGLAYRRITDRKLNRPFKVWLPLIVIFAFFMTLLVVVPLMKQPKKMGMGALFVLATGIPYYACFVKKPIKLPFLRAINAKLTIFTQKIWMCVPQDKHI